MKSLIGWNYGLQQNPPSVRGFVQSEPSRPTSMFVAEDDIGVTLTTSHSTTHTVSSIAQLAQIPVTVDQCRLEFEKNTEVIISGIVIEPEVQQKYDNNNDRVDPSDPARSDPGPGPTTTSTGVEMEVKCSQDLVPDTPSPVESQVEVLAQPDIEVEVEAEQFEELTQVPAIERADVTQSKSKTEAREPQRSRSGCESASRHRSSYEHRSNSRSGSGSRRRFRSSERRTVEISVEAYAEYEEYRKSRRHERRH